jgi:hypothetical protein
MFDLCSYRVLDENKYPDDYQKGATVWDSWFVDRINGDTHFSVLANGRVNHEPVELYYYIADYQDNTWFHPGPIEGNDLKIKRVVTDSRASLTISEDRHSLLFSGL